MKLNSVLLLTTLAACVHPGVNGTVDPESRAPQEGKFVFVDEGRAIAARDAGQAWSSTDGYLVGKGEGNRLDADRSIALGDFHLEASLSIDELDETRACFRIGDNLFGFDGERNRLFLDGELFGGRVAGFTRKGVRIVSGRSFELEVTRKGEDVLFFIDGAVAIETKHAGEFRRIGFDPGSATMRIERFSVRGSCRRLLPSVPHGYSIPMVDIADQPHRQIVVDTSMMRPLGKPDTVTLGDGRTIIVAYSPRQRGMGTALKRSEDGGLNWQEIPDLPAGFLDDHLAPTLHRVEGPDGVERLILMVASPRLQRSVSEDGGRRWSLFEPLFSEDLSKSPGYEGFAAPKSLLPIRNNRILALYSGFGPDPFRRTVSLYRIISPDGGLSWSDPEQVGNNGEYPDAQPSEPLLLRSPEGIRLLCIVGDKSGQYNSLMAISNDEGATWSEYAELPGSLTGAGHSGGYVEDGRLFIAFQDSARDSSTRGDWVGWVGTFEDLLERREGQYRVILGDNLKSRECARSGVELLEDGAIFVVGDGSWVHKELPNLRGLRLSMEELDRMAASQPMPSDLFVPHHGGPRAYRIPSLVATPSGALLAFCDARIDSFGDVPNNIDQVLRRSTDGGKSWSEISTLVDLPGKQGASDPCLLVDRTNDAVWLFYTYAPEGIGGRTSKAGIGEDTLRVHALRSDDDGLTWSSPRDLTSEVKDPEWLAIWTAPGRGLQARDGTLYVPCTIYTRGQKRAYFFLSEDHGQSWKRGGTAGPDVSEPQLVELADGSLLSSLRGVRGNRRWSLSTDRGHEWTIPKEDPVLPEPACQGSLLLLSAAADGFAKDRLLFCNPDDPIGRQSLTLRLSYDEGQTWPVSKVLHHGPSAYSCITMLADGSIGVLFECGTSKSYEKLAFVRLTLEWLTDGNDAWE